MIDALRDALMSADYTVDTVLARIGEAVSTAGTADALDELPPALPQPQGWEGTWGGQRWRPVFIESKSTESN